MKCRVSTPDEVYRIIGRETAQYLYWFLTGLLSISDIVEVLLISVILPSLECQWKLTHSFQSAISMSIFVFYAIFAIAFGKVAYKFGRKLVLLWSMIVLIATSVVSALAPNKWVFIFPRSVAGACIGINYNCIPCYATEFSESKDRLIGLSVLNLVISSSPGFVNLLAWLISRYMGWRWLIVVISLPMIPSLILILILPGSPRHFLVNGQQYKAIEATRFMAKLNKKHLPSDLKLACMTNHEVGSYSTIFGADHRRSLFTLTVQYVSNTFVGFAFILYSPLIYMNDNSCSSASTGKSSQTCTVLNEEELGRLAISAVPLVFGALLAVISAYFFGRRTSLRVGGFFWIPFTVALSFCIGGTVSVVVVSAINIIGSLVYAVLWEVIPETFPTNVRGTATGVISGCGKIGGVLGVASVSILYNINPHIVAGLILAFAILGFVMSLIYNKETRDVSLKDS